MFIHDIEYIIISKLKNLNNEIKNSFKKYDKDIKIFYNKLSYHLTQDKNINTIRLLTEKKKLILLEFQIQKKYLKKNELKSYYIEEIVIYAKAD